MAKCRRCGKTGLFLKLNLHGQCYECEQASIMERKKIEEERRSSETCFINLANVYKSLSKKYDYSKSNVKEAEDCINQKLILHESFKSSVLKFINTPHFYDILLSHSTEGFCYSARNVEEINFTFFNHDTSDDIAQNLLRKSHNILRDIKKEKDRILLDQIFLDKLHSLKRVNIKICETADKKSIDTICFKNVKYSNVTGKTNFERLGNFVSIDVETTGLSHAHDKITEVSAVRFEHWTPTYIFETLVNPGVEIPKNVASLTGISNSMVNSSPYFNQISEDLAAFIGESNIVGHNLDFDLEFLRKSGLSIFSKNRKYYDTFDIAKRTLKKYNEKRPDSFYDVDDYKLTTLCDYYKIRGNLCAHRASSDSLASGYLFNRLSRDRIYNK